MTAEHKDILGRTIELNDVVAFPSHNSLMIATVDKINPKMIKVNVVGRKWTMNKYPQDLVKINGPEATMYLMKNI
jgi:hypothetical protein